MLENPNFEQNPYFETSTEVYKIAHGSFQVMK